MQALTFGDIYGRIMSISFDRGSAMRKDKLCEKIIEDNYAAVFRFCNARLRGDFYGAEDCTQEVFLLFLQKKDALDLSGRIDRWLIAAASRITKQYIRKKAEQTAFETGGIEDITDSSAEQNERSELFDSFTDDEYNLLIRYYSTDAELRGELAAEMGISVNTLYQRIFKLKSKIRGR